MARVLTTVLITVVIVLLFHFAGVIDESNSPSFVSSLSLMNPENFNTSSIMTTILLLTSLGGGRSCSKSICFKIFRYSCLLWCWNSIASYNNQYWI